LRFASTNTAEQGGTGGRERPVWRRWRQRRRAVQAGRRWRRGAARPHLEFQKGGRSGSVRLGRRRRRWTTLRGRRREGGAEAMGGTAEVVEGAARRDGAGRSEAEGTAARRRRLKAR